jgi:hypothetical protein
VELAHALYYVHHGGWGCELGLGFWRREISRCDAGASVVGLGARGRTEFVWVDSL